MTDFTRTEHLDGKVTLYGGDNRDVLKSLADCSIDSIVTDPPYALVSIVKRFGGENAAPAKDGDVYSRASSGFMGKQWDTGETAFATEFWAQIYRVLKPGGHVVAFSGTRSYHRLAVAIEDSGFEIRDQLAWVYGSGFPKSHDVSKGIDKAAGAEREVIGETKRGAQSESTGRYGAWGDGITPTTPATPEAEQWQGWGTALKPAWEPICLARKPLIGTVAENVLEHGTGALNVDGCRVEAPGEEIANHGHTAESGKGKSAFGDFAGIQPHQSQGQKLGRWPANIVHDGSDEVLAEFPDSAGAQGVVRGTEESETGQNGIYGRFARVASVPPRNDHGSAARFFYTAKADKLDRIGSKHPTVKPVDLMQWLCRLVTPKGVVVLDPFAGSGSTGEAAWREGFRAVLIEREEEYQGDIAARLSLADKGPTTRKARAIKQAPDAGPLFGAVANDNGGAGVYTASSQTSSPATSASDGGIMAGKGGFSFRIREHKQHTLLAASGG